MPEKGLNRKQEMKENRVYLAAPYSHPEFHVRLVRFTCVTEKCGLLMKEGHIVFSPVTHGFYLAEICGLPQDAEFWRRWYMTFLERWATALYVYRLPGWNESRGAPPKLNTPKKTGCL